ILPIRRAAAARRHGVRQPARCGGGSYALVRHPLYASGLLHLLAMPLALGSYWALVPIAATMPFLVWRLLDEERFLARDLLGYTEYRYRVRYRLEPFVW